MHFSYTFITLIFLTLTAHNGVLMSLMHEKRADSTCPQTLIALSRDSYVSPTIGQDDASNKNIPPTSTHDFLNKTVAYRNTNHIPVKVDLEYQIDLIAENGLMIRTLFPINNNLTTPTNKTGPSITFNQTAVILSSWSKIINPAKFNLGVDFYGVIELTAPVDLGVLTITKLFHVT
ncbi:hypothetical protein F8M41_020304 [Gigaspora margarita]|uniref:Uncharacterized protein n=1 Tax=Gigaspora margarita TaxID=4874 RepID=A0A8H4AIP5_GIGMA|nr:hypothetical protein F8M41_020304 [Gigaspora margarita]